MTAERHQAPASEALLTGEVAGQWAQVHLVLLDGATVELKVPGVAGVSWGAFTPTPGEPPSIAVTRGAQTRRANLARVLAGT